MPTGTQKPTIPRDPVQAASNLLMATNAVNAISGILGAGNVKDVYLYGSRARGRAIETSTWDFILDFSAPVTPRKFWAIYNGLLAAMQAQAGPGATIYVTSPQYDRPSFTKWAVKSSQLVYTSP